MMRSSRWIFALAIAATATALSLSVLAGWHVAGTAYLDRDRRGARHERAPAVSACPRQAAYRQRDRQSVVVGLHGDRLLRPRHLISACPAACRYPTGRYFSCSPALAIP